MSGLLQGSVSAANMATVNGGVASQHQPEAGAENGETVVAIPVPFDPNVETAAAIPIDPLSIAFLARAREELLTTATVAEQVYAPSWDLQQRRTLPSRIILAAVLFLICMIVVIIIVVVVVVVLGTNKSSSTPTTPTSSSPITLAPTFTTLRTTKPVAPPIFLPTDLNQNDAQDSIFPLVQAGVNHTLLTTYLLRTNLANSLDTGSGQYTFLAPTDASWGMFAASRVSYANYVNESNLYWIDHLRFILQYHIVTEMHNLSFILQSVSLPTRSGLTLKVSRNDGQLGDNDAIIVTADIPAFNGYIDVPNKVLVATQFNRTILFQVVNTTQALSLQLDTLASIILPSDNQDDLLQTLLEQNSVTGLTLLAPSDDAFALANWTTHRYKTAGNATLTRRLMLNHLININLYHFQSSSTTQLWTTMSGFSMWVVNNNKNDTFCNGAQVRKSEYVQNGVVAIIDQVLFPPNLKELLQITTKVTENYKFDTFLNVTQKIAQLGNLLTDESDHVTILAPLEEAFARNASSYKLANRWLGIGWLLHQQSLIRNHFTSQTIPTKEGEYTILMLSGYNTSVQVQSDGSLIVSNVSSEFVENGPLHSTNGLIYFLKGLLVPEWGHNSVNEALGQHSELTKLAALMKTHNLTTLLSGTGPITLLAPSNSAFGALNVSNLGSSGLRTILLGHILNGNWYSNALGSTVIEVAALNNQTWQANVVGIQISVGGGIITTPDLLASNGVIHIIDKVLDLS